MPHIIFLPLRPFELFVGLRYTRAKRRTHFISFISFISVVGIALGIWALITVMSVMNGFEKEIRARILGAAAHIQVLGGEKGIEDWEAVAAVHGEFFGQIRPANTMMQVSRFIDPDWLVELEADAIVDDEQDS